MSYSPPPHPPYPPRPSGVVQPNGFATASVIIGAVSLVGCCFLLVPPYLGLIFGIIGMSRTRRSDKRAAAFAVTGVVLNGFICVALPVLLALGIVTGD